MVENLVIEAIEEHTRASTAYIETADSYFPTYLAAHQYTEPPPHDTDVASPPNALVFF
jgi:hypothetical protein